MIVQSKAVRCIKINDDVELDALLFLIEVEAVHLQNVIVVAQHLDDFGSHVSGAGIRCIS